MAGVPVPSLANSGNKSEYSAQKAVIVEVPGRTEPGSTKKGAGFWNASTNWRAK